MSGEENYQKNFRDRLNKISPSFCAAKWLQVTLHLHSGHNHSCHHPKTHHTSLKELKGSPSALHNTLFKKEQRQKMKDGFRPAECDYCWNVEDLGPDVVSDRTLKSSESWAKPYLEQLQATPAMTDVNPTYVEVSFSNVCNFRCSYCSGNFSSRWNDDLKRNGNYATYSGMQTMDILPEEDNPYIKAFWEWWPDLVKDLHVFRITGGEPLLSKNTFRVLEELSRDPNPNLEVCINSNLGISDASFDRFLKLAKDLVENKKVKSFRLFTSVEAWQEKAEYIRNGLEFKRFQKNLEAFIREVPEAKTTIMATYNALSVTSFKTLLEYVLQLKRAKPYGINGELNIDISYLRHPLYQTIQVLPSRYIRHVEECLEFMKNAEHTTEVPGFIFYEIGKLQRTLEWMRSGLPEEQVKTRQHDFYRFFSEHDQRRQTDFLKTFPEMEDFWKLCQNPE